MPNARRKLAGPDGDYEWSGGEFVDDTTHASQVLWLLKTARGSCGVAPEVGNRLFALGAITTGSETIARAYCLEALSPLVRDGRIRDPQIEVTFIAAGRAEIACSFYDRDARDRVTVNTRIGGSA